MINYSVFTAEFVLEEEYEERDREVLTVNQGLKLLVEKTEDGDGYKIIQVLSTDPRVFLDSRYAPGTVIKMDLQGFSNEDFT